MPRLFHPQLVTLSPLDRAAQRVDELAGEPFAKLERAATVQLEAQVEEGSDNRRRPSQGGAVVSHGGTLTFRRKDVASSSWTPTAGDEVTSVADRDGANPRAVRWYVQTVRTGGKRPRGKRADLVVCTYGTRPPSRGQVEGL